MKVRRISRAGAATLVLAAAGIAVALWRWQWIAAHGLTGPALLGLSALTGLGALAAADALRPLLWIDTEGLHWREDVLLPARSVFWPEVAGVELTPDHLVVFRRMGLPPVLIPRRHLNRPAEALARRLGEMLAGSPPARPGAPPAGPPPG